MSQPGPARRRSRNWVWVFVALALLGGLAIAVNWSYNAAQPLTEEQLRAARELWRRNRPADYDLKIFRTTTPTSGAGAGGTTVDRFDVQVRGGRVVSFLINGKEPEPLLDPDGRRKVDEERRQREHFDVDGLFDDIEEFMALDRREGGKTFLRARFDKQDGHVLQFIRQANKRRLEVRVDLKRVQ